MSDGRAASPLIRNGQEVLRLIAVKQRAFSFAKSERNASNCVVM